MYIPFTCPHCGSFTEVEAQFAGQSGPCYSCGKAVTVPYAPPAGRTAVSTRNSGASLATIGSIMAIVAGGMIAFVCLGALLFWVLGPALTAGGAAAQQSACDTNLKQIGLALESYYQKYNSYPPAYVADAKGKPMHSWRVLILPFLGEQGLYSQYNMNEPWDSTQNMAVARRMPTVFACPSDITAIDNGETSYLVVVGKGTAFPGVKGITKAEILDKPGQTVLVVESHSSAIGWTEPKDLTTGMLFHINGGTGKGGGAQEISSRHPHGANVLLADNETGFLHDTLPAEAVEALLTIAGKDVVPSNAVEKDVDDVYP